MIKYLKQRVLLKRQLLIVMQLANLVYISSEGCLTFSYIIFMKVGLILMRPFKMSRSLLQCIFLLEVVLMHAWRCLRKQCKIWVLHC